ncbi:MAG: sugar phosphate isomerase/epimerase [Lentisphaeria bacterium]|nr:sugar phosphate isomerase/epimerase [Lentisphaeria bacterium]
MRKYAFSFPIDLFLEPAWVDALGNAKLKRIELNLEDNDTADTLDERIARIVECQAAGKVIVGSVHIPFGSLWPLSDLDDDLRKAASIRIRDFIEACAPLNCKDFTLHGCLEPQPTEEPLLGKAIAQFRKTMDELIPVAEKFGVSLNIEDLPRTCLGKTAEELARMIDGLPKEQVGICFDVNHFCGHPERLAAGIDLLADRIRTFHISDYDGDDECHWYPMLGTIDWAAVMASIRKLPQDVLMVIEAFSFLVKPNWQKRPHHPEVFLRSHERNVFVLENAAELQKRISEMDIR